jgi:hypothetical protein
MQKIIIKTPDTYDSDDVVWLKGNNRHGSGYKPKNGNPIGLVRCPECDTENYAPVVGKGICYKCGFDANK